LKEIDYAAWGVAVRVLVTGGAGYIGSHTCVELLAAGHQVFVIDNLSNCHVEAIERVRVLSNRALGSAKADVRNGGTLDCAFDDFKPDAVIHFAGLKAVSESVAEPLRYYDVNVRGSVSLLEAMDRAGCANIVFSSSATVYGDPEYLHYYEAHPTRAVNPYGRTKLMVEEILRDWTA
jgi:UDP-glucose 4-epimerase